MNARTLLACALVSLATAACSDSSGPCGTYYDNSKKCWVEEAKKRIDEGHGDEDDVDDIPGRGAFIAACKDRMRKHKDELMARVECSKEETCEEKDACEEKVREAERAKEQVEDIQKYVDKANWEEAFRECRYLPDEPADTLLAACEKVYAEGMPALVKGGKGEDVQSACSYSDDLKKKAPAFAKACVDVMSSVFEEKKKAAITARDAASDDNYMQCSDLRTVAEAVGEQAKKDAEALCTEMTIASSAKTALTESQAIVASKRSEVSYYCTSALDSLTTLEPKSDWAKKTMDSLIKACFLDVGKVIVEVELASEYPYCSYSLTQVYDAIPKYGLTGKDPEFDAAIAKTNKLCNR